jgi:hypothetical protein
MRPRSRIIHATYQYSLLLKLGTKHLPHKHHVSVSTEKELVKVKVDDNLNISMYGDDTKTLCVRGSG